MNMVPFASASAAFRLASDAARALACISSVVVAAARDENSQSGAASATALSSAVRRGTAGRSCRNAARNRPVYISLSKNSTAPPRQTALPANGSGSDMFLKVSRRNAESRGRPPPRRRSARGASWWTCTPCLFGRRERAPRAQPNIYPSRARRVSSQSCTATHSSCETLAFL